MWKFLATAAITACIETTWANDLQKVTFSAIGKARVGMSEREIDRASGAHLTHVEPDTEEKGCSTPRLAGYQTVQV